MGITHMMFADDLLMFARADKHSVKVIFDAFTKFSDASGLVANWNKSDVYLAGIPPSEEDIIISSLGIPKGTFPFNWSTFNYKEAELY